MRLEPGYELDYSAFTKVVPKLQESRGTRAAQTTSQADGYG